MIIMTEKRTFVDIGMSQDEVETLKYAYKILAQVKKELSIHGNDWISPSTGEVVCMDELPRALGILDAFAENSDWELVGD